MGGPIITRDKLSRGGRLLIHDLWCALCFGGGLGRMENLLLFWGVEVSGVGSDKNIAFLIINQMFVVSISAHHSIMARGMGEGSFIEER